MTSQPGANPPDAGQWLLDAFLRMETPPGLRAELIEGEIVVSPIGSLSNDGQWLLDEFLRLEIPEGFRAELLDKEIIVSPPPSGRHERAISAIITQVIRRSAVDMSVSGNRGLLLPGEQGTDVRHVIPDAVFAPEELDVFNTDSSWMEPDGVALVVEVTSQRPRDDRLLKHRAYARAEVPLYLLVDRDTETAHLYSEPNPNTETYTQTASAPFGSPLPFPAPFSFTLDTSRFD